MTTDTPVRTAPPLPDAPNRQAEPSSPERGHRLWYAFATLLVIIAFLVTLPIRSTADNFYGVPFFLAAVMVASWYGGFLPGLAATVLSLVGIGVFFLPPASNLGQPDSSGLWHLATFAMIALAVHGFSFWRAQVESSLKAARSDLLEANAAAARYLQAEREARQGIELSHYRISRLQAVTASLSRAVTPTEVAEAVVNEGAAALGAWAGSIVLFDRQRAEGVIIAHTGYDSDLIRRYMRMPLSLDVPLTQTIRTGQPLFISSAEELLAAFPDSDSDEGSKAWASIPLIQNDLVIGAMGLSFAEEHEFDAADREMMNVLGSQCAQAFERARLYQAEHQARQAAEKLSYRSARLQAVTAALSGATTPGEVAHVVVEEGTAALGASRGLLIFLARDGQSLQVAGARGYPADMIQQYAEFPVSASQLFSDPLTTGEGTFLETREAIVQNYPSLERMVGELGTDSLAVLPLRAHGQFMGILSMSFREPRRFSNEEQELMKAFANQAAQALERARLYERQNEARLAAEEAEERYRALAESIPALVILADPRGRAFYHNRRFVDYVGKSAAEIRSSEWWRIMHPADRREIARRWREAMAGVEQGELEFRMRNGEGQYRWHTGRTIPIRDADGGVRMWVGFSIDVQERKRAEQALRDSEEQYRSLAESMPALVSVAGNNGDVQYVNKRWLDYTGATMAELQGLGWQRFIHPDDAEGFLAKWSNQQAEGSVLEDEVRFLHRDGQYRWLRIQIMPMARLDGRPYRWVSVSTDVEEIRQSRERERFLSAASAVLSSSLDYRTILDQVGHLLVPDVGDCFAIYTVEESATVLVSRDCTFDAEFIHELLPVEATRAPKDHPVARALTTGQPQYFADGYETPSGCKARSFIVVPFMARGDRLGAIAIAQLGAGKVLTEADLSMLQELARRLGLAVENARLYGESEAAQQRLKLALEAKDEFLGLMSHELRTPTTTIYGGIRVLRARDKVVAEEDRDALLLDMETESDRLFRMIEDLLILGRLEEGALVPTEPVRLHHEVNRIVSSYAHRRLGRKINVRGTDQEMPMVACDPTYLEQVVRNLLNNAEKYSPAKGEIDVEVQRNDDEVVVAVLDRGPGVAPEDLSHIFDKFYRAEVTARQVRGIGLGLTVCKRLIEAQAGQIWAEPRAGGGLAIKFSLPYYQEVIE